MFIYEYPSQDENIDAGQPLPNRRFGRSASRNI